MGGREGGRKRGKKGGRKGGRGILNLAIVSSTQALQLLS